MITRDEYMKDSKNLHSAYHGQFVTKSQKARVVSYIGLERLKSGNPIPLDVWDRIPVTLPASPKMKDCGDYLTGCGCTCINKEAARLALLDAGIIMEVEGNPDESFSWGFWQKGIKKVISRS